MGQQTSEVFFGPPGTVTKFLCFTLYR